MGNSKWIRELLKNSTFWVATGQIVTSLCAVAALGLSLSQLRMAYQEADETRAESERIRAKDERLLAATSRPYLALNRQYAGIEVEVQEDRSLRFPRRKDSGAPVSTLIVKNYGTGPALNCKMEFHTTSVNFYSNGEPIVKEEEATECWVEPRNIMPGQEAVVRGWPKCFDRSPKQHVADAAGYIVFTCDKLDGTKQEYKETFSIANGLAATPYPLLKLNAWGTEFPWDTTATPEAKVKLGR